MKMDIKRENNDFLVIPLKHVRDFTNLINCPESSKLWVITHENIHKRENNEFLVIPLKNVRGLMELVNRPETSKLWAITHESDHKTRKRRVFGHASQKSTGSQKARNSPYMLKSVGYCP
jgi:hypothetical protein